MNSKRRCVQSKNMHGYAIHLCDGAGCVPRKWTSWALATHKCKATDTSECLLHERKPDGLEHSLRELLALARATELATTDNVNKQWKRVNFGSRDAHATLVHAIRRLVRNDRVQSRIG